jgi:hypothetical protein
MAVHHPLDTFATSLGTSLGVAALCENADLIERFREPPQAAAVGEHSQCLLDDLLWTLANACPFSAGGLLRFTILSLTQASRVER